MNRAIPEDELTVAMTEVPLWRGVPGGYIAAVFTAGGTGFFFLQAAGLPFGKTLAGVIFAVLVLWAIGAEITRRDDRQLGIFAHYFVTRFLLDILNAVATGKPRDRSLKGRWYEI